MEIHQPIQFGDFPVNILEILHPEPPTPPQSVPPASKSPPLSPQLRWALNPNPPRSPVFLPRKVFPEPSPTSTTITGSYVAVPSRWSTEAMVPYQASYISRDPLLRKMFPRRILYRTFEEAHVNPEEDMVNKNKVIAILKTPVDYWLTFPIEIPNRPECLNPPPLDGVTLGPEEVTSAWSTEREKCSRKNLDRMVGMGPQRAKAPNFPWVKYLDAGSKKRNYLDATKLVALERMTSLDVEEIVGFNECPKCKEIFGIVYDVQSRFEAILCHLALKSHQLAVNPEKVLQYSDFNCGCDANVNHVKPIISENWWKINWLFLVLGCSLGYCTVEQLRCYCIQRELVTTGNKKLLLRRVFLHLLRQLKPDCSI